MKLTFLLNNTIQVFRLGITSNAKISVKNKKIVQTYTFSVEQFNYIKEKMASGEKSSFKHFFSLDVANCFDCPFSGNSGNSKCYTHKFTLYSGFIKMIGSLVNEFKTVENIPTYVPKMAKEIAKLSVGKYVRFGSYGEPTMHPFEVVQLLAENSISWTGYTHQYTSNKKYH